MAITFQSISTAVAGTTSAALNIPASVASTDLLIAHSASKPFSAFPTWQNFAPVASIASGSVANGSGTGSVISTQAVRIADSGLTGTETMTVASGTPSLGAITRWSIAGGKMWDLQNSQGADTTVTGTGVSATGGTLSVQPNDVIVITVATNDDLNTHSAQALTIAGATLSAITWVTPMTTITGNDGALMVGRCTVTAGTVTAAPVYTATAGVSGQSAAGVAFMRLREIDPALPGFMGYYGDPMVEPESHTHNIPVIDGNGNLYRHGESNLSHDTNRLLIHKSTDGGIVWKSVAWASHPNAQDLEATWVHKVGTKVYYMINRDTQVWLTPFNMSDDGSPDTYGTQEQIDAPADGGSSVQYCSFTVLSTGVMHCFYSDTLVTSNNQIAKRTRTAVNTYDTKVVLNDGTTQNVTGPAAVLGANDITYLFYHNKTSNTLVYRTVSADGATISATTAVASGSGLSSQSMPHTNPVYYDDAGVEVIGIAYINDSDILKYRELRNGVLQTEETISTAALTRNPGTTDSQAVVAHLAVDGKNVHAMWSRAADGDLLRDVRVFGTGWGTDTVVWASAGETGWYIYCDVVTIGTDVYLHYTYDQGIHVDDASNINYNRVFLRTLGSTGTAAVTQDSQTAAATGSLGINYLNQYTLQGGTTSLTMVPPAGSAADDLDIIWVANKNSSVTPTNPSGGWTLLGQQAIGTGSDGVGTGQIMLTAWYRVLAGASTNTSVTITGANRSIGGGMIYRKLDASLTWAPTISFGSDVTSDTAFSATVAANLGLLVGDYLLSVGVFTLNTSLPGRNLTVPGVTFNLTGINSAGGAVGNQIFVWTDHAISTAGTQSAASVTTGTSGAATTGGALNIRVTASDATTGTAATTQAGDTAAASGILGYTGTSAATQAADTASATGAVTGPVTGTAAATQADQTASAAGQLGYSGIAAPSQAANTAIAVGKLGYTGTASVTQANQTSAASGALGYTGAAAVTQAANTATASGLFTTSGIVGSAAPTQADQTSTAVGILRYTGSSAASQANQTAAASGKLGYSGTAAVTQAANTASGSGTFTGPISGTAAVVQTDQTAAASGILRYTGTVAVSQGSDTAVIQGVVFIPVTGTAAATQADQTATAVGSSLGSIVVRPNTGITPRPFTTITPRP